MKETKEEYELIEESKRARKKAREALILSIVALLLAITSLIIRVAIILFAQ